MYRSYFLMGKKKAQRLYSIKQDQILNYVQSVEFIMST